MLTLAKAAKRSSLKGLTNTPTVLKLSLANGTPVNPLPGHLPTPTKSSTYYKLHYILGITLEVQELFFDLYLLEDVQNQYSAGEMRIENANKATNLKSIYYPEIEALYIEYRTRAPQPKKEDCYKWVAQTIKNNHPGKKIPTAGTIKNYLKSKKYLP